LQNKHTNNILVSIVPGILSIFLSLFSIPIFLNHLSNGIYANYLIQHFILTLGFILNLQLGKITSIKIQSLNNQNKKNFIKTTIFFTLFLGIILSTLTYMFMIIVLKNYNLFQINFSILIGLILTIIYITLEYIAKGLSCFKETSFSNLIFYSLSMSVPAFLVLSSINENLILNNLFNISLIIKFLSIFYLFIILSNKKIFVGAKIKLKLIKTFIFHSKWMTLNALYNQIYDYLDKHLIKISMGSSMLIIYSIPQQIAAKLTIISNSIISVILPKLAFKKKSDDKLKIFTANFYLFYYLVGTSLIIFLPLYETVLNWWLKDGYSIEILKLFKIFILLTFLGSCSNIIISLYEANSIEKKNTTLETFSIFPFLLGLFLSLNFKNIYFFALVLMIKEFTLLLIRINVMKNYIFNYKILMIQLFFYSTIFVLSYLELNNFVLLFFIVLLIITFINFPLSFLKNEFTNK
jgi:O-antigen/teichoic acid export membrane protein